LYYWYYWYYWYLFVLLILLVLHSTKSCPYECLGAWHKTYQVIRIILEPQHICEKHVIFALLVWCRMCLFPAGFLRILLIIFPGILKGWLPILSKHMLIHSPILQECMQLFEWLNMCVRNIYWFCVVGCCEIHNSTFSWRLLAHSTSHAPINVWELDPKHIKSLKLFQSHNIFVRNMLVVLCWFGVVCVCSVQVSCTFCQSCSQASWEVDCQSCQSTW